MSKLRFDGRVAVVTGAGNGLGKCHALSLAARGAHVIVNDLGGGHTGGGKSSAAADAVVAEIVSSGGSAIANYDSVEDGAKIVQCALDAWGRIDILVNNAGILRDSSFAKMSAEDWDLIYRVHVLGAYRTTQAAWGPMREAGYGRILFTASAAGLYGNFGQANYAMAKLGLVGLTKTLAIEGQKKNVFCNVIAPIAGSRMTETILPPELLAALKPEYVTPLLLWLAHEDCQENGSTYEVGGGFIGKLRWERSAGKLFKLGKTWGAEDVQAAWPQIGDFAKATHPQDVTDAMGPVLTNATATSLGGNEFIDVDLALGHELPSLQTTLMPRDLALYALAVGAARDRQNTAELRYVYEAHANTFVALPTYAVIPALNYVYELAKQGITAPGLNYGFERILHGEHSLELLRPYPTEGTIEQRGKIKAIYDKGKNAVVVMEIVTKDAAGDLIARNELSMLVRGAGGWGGDRGPAAESLPTPARAPESEIKELVEENQALLYRLTGDTNPLHADPEFARAFGFDRPILHGLCTLGIAVRQIVHAFCGGDPRLVSRVQARFAGSVYPGDTLVTKLWREGDEVRFETAIEADKRVVLSHARVVLHREVSKAAKPQIVAPSVATASAATAAGTGNEQAATARVFAAISDYVANHPELIKQIGTVYAFELATPDSRWTLDLKNAPGKVSEGADGKAECTLQLTDADFQAMTTGQADPQKLYFSQRLKVSGNIMASQKLNFLKKLADSKAAPVAHAASDKSQAAPSGAERESSALTTRALFDLLAVRLTIAPQITEMLSATLQFVISGVIYVVVGKSTEVGATLTLDDAAFGELVGGASAQDLFQRGKLRIDGNMHLVRNLDFLQGLQS